MRAGFFSNCSEQRKEWPKPGNILLGKHGRTSAHVRIRVATDATICQELILHRHAAHGCYPESIGPLRRGDPIYYTKLRAILHQDLFRLEGAAVPIIVAVICAALAAVPILRPARQPRPERPHAHGQADNGGHRMDPLQRWHCHCEAAQAPHHMAFFRRLDGRVAWRDGPPL